MQKLISRQFLLSDLAVLSYLALLAIFIHFLTNGGYGYFRDEFYYMACGKHLAWGYVDQPPFVALMAFVTRHLLGDSLFALRFFPAICGGLIVLLTGLMVREFGGGRLAQALAAVAVMVAPVYLAIDNFFSMNCFDQVFWALAWSGNWKLVVENAPPDHQVRVVGGYNDFDFCWPLKPGESLRTPFYCGGFSNQGFGGASRLLHRFERDEILPDHAHPHIRPVMYNSCWVRGKHRVAEKAVFPLLFLRP